MNWGGYAAGGGLLAGSPSALPSAPNDPNTRDYPWDPGRPYRLRVSGVPGAPGRWRAEITDLRSGRTTVIRDLEVGGQRLGSAVVWSEVFARCDHPSVTVRWSGLEAMTAGGRVVRPEGVSVSYEASAAGGCDNTTVTVDDLGVLQTTNSRRLVRQGTAIDLRRGSASSGPQPP